MGIQKIKEAIACLPPNERAELAAWLEAQQAPASKHKPVPYEGIAHLSGILKGGQPDLARNKRYLEKLGESSMR